jgi:hypothetical protein
MTKSHHRCDTAAAQTGWQLAGVAAAAAAMGVTGACPAAALDLSSESGLITETIASRDRLKFYDDIKKFGVEAVSERDRQFALPDGIRASTYILFPYADEALVYDDNIYGTATNKQRDWRSELSAALSAQSHLPRHVLDFNLGAKLVSYLDHPDQDYVNADAGLRSAIHIDHANTLGITAVTAFDHEERNEITAPLAAAEPVPVLRNRATVGLTHDAGKLYGTLSISAENQNFQDVRAIDGSKLDQDIRDQTIFSGQLRAGYRFSPGYEAIGKVRVLRATNDGDAVTDRDANGYEALAGIAWETNPLIKWELLGGMGWRDYDRADLDTLQTQLLEGHLRWLPTQRLSLYATAKYAIEDTIGAQDTGRISHAGTVRGEYEIFHDLVATAGAGINESDFIGQDRTDLTLSANAGLQYFYTKNILFTIGYSYENRQSTDDSFDLNRNQIRFGGRLRF